METIEGLSNSQRQNEEGSRAGVAAHIGCNWDSCYRRWAAVGAVTRFEYFSYVYWS